jgi:magnesium chelatase family protein
VQLGRQGIANARLHGRQIEQSCLTTRAAEVLLETATAALGLSARAHHRILKVARTIADLAGETRIDVAHVGEAVALRRLDRVPGQGAVSAPAAANE